jgi:arabinan endo-1,5-alpha-L-arabinosidase
MLCMLAPISRGRVPPALPKGGKAMNRLLPICAALCLLFPIAVARADRATQPVLSGDLRIHDPSVIVVNGTYVAFGTGAGYANLGAIRIKTSPDGIAWKDAGFVSRGIPEWVKPTIGIKPPELWAPTISRRGDTYYLYYAASIFGGNTSAIGLATNNQFDPLHPAKGWKDQGVVLTTTARDDFNAIDAARIDTPDGRAWLAFGSYWTGIKMREIDPVTGKLTPDNPTLYSLAARGRGAIEAASILRHGDHYYLFVSFDRCCAGVASTYRILVGRADTVTGPYLDREGDPMLKAGGTKVQSTTGRFIGPGGQEVFTAPAGDMLAYHYYDRDDGGASKLQIAPIRWDAEGWPSLDPLPEEASR